jgi:hypothetical protein
LAFAFAFVIVGAFIRVLVGEVEPPLIKTELFVIQAAGPKSFLRRVYQTTRSRLAGLRPELFPVSFRALGL